MEGKQAEKTNKNETEFLTLAEAAKLVGYTPEYLNLRARQKKLKAIKIGRNWHTKKEWVDEFLAGASGEVKKTEEPGLFLQTPNQGLSSFAKAKDSKTLIETMEDKPAEIKNEKISQNIFYETEENKKIETLEIDHEIKISEPQKVKSYWMQIFAVMSSAIIILPLVFAATYYFRNFIQNYKTESIAPEIFSVGENFSSQIINENEIAGKVAGEENVAAANSNKSKIVLASENYKVRDINVGGDIMILENGENLTPEIYDIKSESFVANKKDEVKLVVAWKTNKMAVSELTYSKNNGQNSRSVKENSYGFNHGVVLSELEPRTSYVYQIKCKDRWSNETLSNYFGIYTASKPVSVFDLIANAIGEVFGWAIKK